MGDQEDVSSSQLKSAQKSAKIGQANKLHTKVTVLEEKLVPILPWHPPFKEIKVPFRFEN